MTQIECKKFDPPCDPPIKLDAHPGTPMRNLALIPFQLRLLCVGLIAATSCSSGTKGLVAGDENCCRSGTVYEVPELTKAPLFPGGDAAMAAWLGNRLTRPEGTQDVKDGPLIQFHVTCVGTLTDIAVKVPAHPAMDSIAMQAIREMPNWSPGKIKDRAVCTFHVIQVNFDRP